MKVVRKKYDRSYYDALIHREIPNSSRNRNRLRAVLARKREGKLLEIGCGKGEFLKLAQKHFDVEGMDTSRYAIAAVRGFLGKKARREDVELATLMPEHYDVIAIFNVLEHLKRPGQVIDKIYHGLAKRGIVIGSVPNNAGLIGKLHTALANLCDRTHCSTHPPHHWLSLFRKSGFRKIQFFGEIMVGKNTNMYIRRKFWKHTSFNLMFICEK
jgi:2-polyprenyl-3-methyl-5-hydroxy-6-metoxy-1,4-benzoquinol methylase